MNSDRYEELTNFFDFAAEVGLTKHIGGQEATDTLAELCHLHKGKYLLDVGCGVGMTPCHIARKNDCKVMGVDILPAMVERAKERARKEGLTDLVVFRVADAQNLPFEDNLFDAVITESVTAFPEDKQKAVNEYVRVTRPGGYIGLNETTWLKYPQPAEILTWASQEVGANVKPLLADEWKKLLETAGVNVIFSQIYQVNLQDESKGILKRYGFGGMMSILGRMLRLYIKSSNYRQFVKRVQKGGVTPANLDEYFGYGLFVGRKSDGLSM